MSAAGVIGKTEYCKCDQCGKAFARMAMKPEDIMLVKMIHGDKHVRRICDECKKKEKRHN